QVGGGGGGGGVRGVGGGGVVWGRLVLSLGAAQAQTATTTTLTSSPAISQCGDDVVVFVTVVSPVAPATGTPTGTVTFVLLHALGKSEDRRWRAFARSSDRYRLYSCRTDAPVNN